MPPLLLHPGFVEAFSRGCNWLTYVLLALWLSPQDYGTFSFALAIVLLLSALSTTGQDRTILRYIGADKSDKPLVFSSALVVALPGCTVVLLASVLLLKVTGLQEILQAAGNWVWLWTIMQALYLLLVALCRGLNLTHQFALLRGAYGISKLIGMAVIAATLGTVEHLVMFEGVLVALFALSILVANRRFVSFRMSSMQISTSASFGVPLVLHVLAGTTLGQVDKLMIGHYLDESTLGVYAFLNSIAGGVFFVFAVINIVFEPKVYQLGDSSDAEALMRRMFLIAFSVAVTLLVIANLSLPFILELLDKLTYYDASVMATLSIAYLIYPLYLQGNIRFALKEKTRFIPLMTGVAATVNVVMNIVLLPTLGIWGAALSTLVSYVVLVTFAQVVSRRV